MTTPPNDATARLLRDLDPADQRLSQAQRARAAATLERILATDPTGAAPATALGQPPAPPRRGGPRRLLLAGTVATLAATAAVVGPSLTRGTEAFASWSPTPVGLTGADRTAALEACMVLQRDGEPAELAFDPGAPGSALVAERRGGWSYVLFTVTGTSGRRLQGSCLMPDDLVADPVPGRGGFFGGLGGAEETAGPRPARDVVRQDSHGVGTVDDKLFAYAEGRAGADVVGIEVTTPGGRQVEASLENGRWAAWWPAGDDPSGPEVSGAPTYEVTLGSAR